MQHQGHQKKRCPSTILFAVGKKEVQDTVIQIRALPGTPLVRQQTSDRLQPDHQTKQNPCHQNGAQPRTNLAKPSRACRNLVNGVLGAHKNVPASTLFGAHLHRLGTNLGERQIGE